MLVFMLVIMHFYNYSMLAHLLLGVREGILIILFDRRHYPSGAIACGFAIFSRLTSSKIFSLVAKGALRTSFSIGYPALTIILNHRDQRFFL